MFYWVIIVVIQERKINKTPQELQMESIIFHFTGKLNLDNNFRQIAYRP